MAREVAEELQFHFDALVDELVARGGSPGEARRIAQRRFGRLDLVRDRAHYAKGIGLIDELRQDVRLGFRRLCHQPGFTLAVVLTFGLGIGINTALFSLVDALVLKPLPFNNADRLVDILSVSRKGTAEEARYRGLNTLQIEQWRSQRQIFDAVEQYGSVHPLELWDTEQTLFTADVSPGLFPLLGVGPALGRGFSPEEAGRRDMIIISNGLWKRAFGSDPHVLGRRLQLNAGSPAVIGVMPSGFRFPLDSRATDVWFPLGGPFVGRVVARLRPGLTQQSAQAYLDRAADAIQKAHPAQEPWGAEVVTIDPRTAAWFSPRSIALVAFGAVVFVLLTACANVANLLFARTTSRQREMAVRRALGAGRLRIARQLLAETGMLAAGGVVVTVALAGWLVRMMPAIMPARLVWLPVHEMKLDGRVLGFAIAATAVVGLLSGLLPALRGSREDPASLSTAVPTAARTRLHRRSRNVLIAVQAALALVLLTGAGLMTASFARMVLSDLGYDTRNLLSVDVRLPRAAHSREDGATLMSRFLEHVRSIPGVLGAAQGSCPTKAVRGVFIVEGTEGRPRSGLTPALLQGGPDYFRVLGIPIVAGRAFSDHDRADTMPVAIIDERAARQAWPGQNPIGKRFRYSPFAPSPWLTVVGIARPVKLTDVAEARESFQVYLPLSQTPGGRALLVRADDDTARDGRLLAAIRARLQTLEPSATIANAEFADEAYGEAFASPRFTTLVIALFAGLALLTAAVGVYAVLWYTVTQRTSELGVRMALGARAGDVWRLVVADALRPVLAGMCAGIVAALWLTKFIASQLYHVGPRDPVTIGLVLAFFILVAIAAASGPAWKAARIDPLAALRCE
jgi:putative ABC transport system permease protein